MVEKYKLSAKYKARQSVNTIGKNLRRLREARGYSQKKIAALINVSFQQVQKYENGANRLPIEKLYILKNFYNVSYGAFFEGVDTGVEHKHSDEQELHYISKRLLTLDDSRLKRKIFKTVKILLE